MADYTMEQIDSMIFAELEVHTLELTGSDEFNTDYYTRVGEVITLVADGRLAIAMEFSEVDDLWRVWSLNKWPIDVTVSTDTDLDVALLRCYLKCRLAEGEDNG